MPETSQHFFWLSRGSGGTGGTVSLKSTFLVFLVIFLQTWAKIDARNIPKILLNPRRARGDRGDRGNRGDRGDSFLKIYILGIFGNISSNLSLDRCQKSPKNFFGELSGGTVGGASFLKISILDIFGNISLNLSLDRCQKHHKKIVASQGGQGGE